MFVSLLDGVVRNLENSTLKFNILKYVHIGVQRILLSIFPGWPYTWPYTNSFPGLKAVMTTIIFKSTWDIVILAHQCTCFNEIPWKDLPLPSPHPNQCCVFNTRTMARENQMLNMIQHWIGGGGGFAFGNKMYIWGICPNTFESDCSFFYKALCLGKVVNFSAYIRTIKVYQGKLVKEILLVCAGLYVI